MEVRSFAYDEDSSPADISNGFYFRQLQENSRDSQEVPSFLYFFFEKQPSFITDLEIII